MSSANPHRSSLLNGGIILASYVSDKPVLPSQSQSQSRSQRKTDSRHLRGRRTAGDSSRLQHDRPEPHDVFAGRRPTAATSRSASRCASSTSPERSCRLPRIPTTRPTRCSPCSRTAWACASIDLQNNRGDGGQNEIGPELFRDIAVLRTSELLSAHRIDGAEQYFTRAIDYGYSFDPQEVIDKWGREEIVGDYVRLIRTLPPRCDADDEHPGPRRRPRP